MEYWVLFKNGLYVSDIDSCDNFEHTENKSEAFRFYRLSAAMRYMNRGYAVLKETT